MRRSTQVLIVDDRKVVRETLRDTLLGFDCAYWEAEDGSTALKLMSATEFDIVFLDLKLPDLSGIEILREAKRLGIANGKVIVLTGFPEPATEEEATKLGAFRYLKKSPIDWQEIRAAFAEAAPDSIPPSPAPSSELEFGRLAGAKPRPRARISRGADPRGVSRPRLLVLDDNRPWLDTMEQVLGSDFDLTLTTSTDEACKKARKEKFALVVLDMRLVGGVSGLDVLSRMRRANPDLRAIILTGYPDYESSVESVRRGALDYVSKGGLATLTDMVKRILGENAIPIRVFLSYDPRDRVKVSRLYEKLMGRGFLPWMNVKSIVAGRKWELETRKAIEKSDYFVFCFSRHSLDKEGVMHKEIKQALEREGALMEDSIFFIPARLDDCEVVEPITRFQYVDLFRRDGFAKLLRALSSGGKTGNEVNIWASTESL